jgi:hypothetical protein
MQRAIIVLVGIVITIISVLFLPAPFIWIFISWFIVFLAVSKYSTKSFTKALFFYLSFVPLAFGIFETYLWITEKPEVQADYPKNAITRNHEILGYAPRKNNTAAHRKYYGKELIFDVVYTIDADGLRISPPFNPGNNNGGILFFGGSFTFGTGVNDKETMPYQVGIKTRGRYRVYNFGFRGYGPHQMLSAIEHGLVDGIVKYKPRYAIYQALLGHIGRAAGLGFWDEYGPKYILNKDGTIIYAGHFDKQLTRILIKSLIFRKILVKKLSQLHFDKKYVNLFIEILSASRKMIESRYPGCEFHVIFRDDNNHKNNAEVLEKLKEKGIIVHLISDIFKGVSASVKKSQLRISKHDAHPTPLANAILADYVVKQIIKEGSVTGKGK